MTLEIFSKVPWRKSGIMKLMLVLGAYLVGEKKRLV
jgi:hypothetical protein